MMNKTILLFFLSATVLLILLGGCTHRATREPENISQQVGMHIDAMFEFAMEYPLSWVKTRHQNRATGWGEVHWTDPGAPEVQMTVTSEKLTDEVVDLQQHLAHLLAKAPKLEVIGQEEIALPEGRAQHAWGNMAESVVHLYLLNSASRKFTIRFVAPSAIFDDYQDILDDALHSFITLTPDNITLTPDNAASQTDR